MGVMPELLNDTESTSNSIESPLDKELRNDSARIDGKNYESYE